MAILNKQQSEDLLMKFTKSKHEIIPMCPGAHAFFTLLTKGVDPITVIDEMMAHYEKVVRDQQDLLMKYVRRNGPLPTEDICQK